MAMVPQRGLQVGSGLAAPCPAGTAAPGSAQLPPASVCPLPWALLPGDLLSARMNLLSEG